METSHKNTKYWAFISYSHRDSPVATWLHKRLETYTIPKSLIGTRQRNGVVPRRIFPVFRDRDELPTSSDLGENIRQALVNSHYLIIIATPNSASSRWVNEEVSWFRKVHRNSNLLVLIANGEPNATDRGAPENECFCPNLRYQATISGDTGTERSEPIAADIRPTGDGKSRAFLKIVAGILGVSFDDLYKRESRRRRTRMLLGASAGTLIAITLFTIVSNLEQVKTDQEAMVSKQEEIQNTVASMRESGPYKEIGRLPKDRREALEELIKESGIESFLASMSQNVENDMRQENELLKPLQDTSSKEGAAAIVQENPQERDFIVLLKIWLGAVEREHAIVSKLEIPDMSEMHNKWNKYSEEFYDRINVLWKFSNNLEEKLVIQEVYTELQNRMLKFQDGYFDQGRASFIERQFRLMEESIQDPDHAFSLERFKVHYESAAVTRLEELSRKINQAKKQIAEYGDSSINSLPEKYIVMKNLVVELLAYSESEKRSRYDLLEMLSDAEKSLTSYHITPDYVSALINIIDKEEKEMRDMLEALKQDAAKADEKIITRMSESGQEVDVGRLEHDINL